MILNMEKNTIITLKLRGMSNREIERGSGVNRKTVAKYWQEYRGLVGQLELEPDKNIRPIQEQIISAPTYDVSSRKPVKYTPEIDAAIDLILESEAEKARELGESNKQKLTHKQIHGLLREQGHDIGLTVVTIRMQGKRNRHKEVYIRQEYDFGQRLEYDFGEVKLVINGAVDMYYLAVFGAPRSSFRWAYLYKTQKKDVFLDSHVRFFAMVGGAYRETAYDNMRNVVTKFIGRNEKELNADLIAMSTYYGFSINVTNCFRGNEKGYVESSVKEVRKEAFAVRYRFDSFEEAEKHLERELERMNDGSLIAEEMAHLLPWRPPLELSRMTEQLVDKYSFVRVGNNFYSVPEYLVGRRVTVRSYVAEIVVYAGFDEVCSHEKKDGRGEMSVDILHYLETLAKKPGAIRNSKALRSESDLKAVYECYYTTRAREFIDNLRACRDKPMHEIVGALRRAGEGYAHACSEVIGSNVLRHTKSQLYLISDFFMKGRAANGN
jgi:transposase